MSYRANHLGENADHHSGELSRSQETNEAVAYLDTAIRLYRPDVYKRAGDLDIGVVATPKLQPDTDFKSTVLPPRYEPIYPSVQAE